MIKKWAALGLSVVALSAGAAAAQEGRSSPWPGSDADMRGRPRGNAAAGPVIDQLSELTGLTLIEIREALRNGQTLAEVVEASGADLDAVVKQIVMSMTERVQAQVDEGRLNSERAEDLLTELPAAVEDLLNTEPPLRGRLGVRDRMLGERYDHYLLRSVMQVTGLTRAELRSKLDAGMSWAAILEEADQSLEAFIDTLLEPVRERLSQAVSDGHINQAIADARLELLEVELEYRLTLPRQRAR